MTFLRPESAAFSSASIIFEGARVARSAFNARYRTLSVRGSQIESVCMTGAASPSRQPAEGVCLDLSGYMALPGLINAHDHLDFSVFPRLARGPWPNWREWGAEIHRSERPCIEECLRIPPEVRMWWGGIRNVLCGVTTVSHHNPYAPEIFGAEFPVHVPREYGWAHSVADADRVEASLRETPACWPVVIHLAEGTDQGSAREFDALEDLVQLDERIVLVHCVGLTPSQWDRAARSGAGIVWCPSSNLFTLGRTLSAEQIATFPNIALGSDSPISGAGDLLDEIRLAHGEMGIPAPLVYDLVTARAARLLRLSAGEGSLQSGSKADLIVTRDRALTPAETLIQLTWRDVELVMEGGRIVLLSGGIADRIPNELKEGLQDVSIDGVERFVRAPVADLWFQTFAALGRMPTISGRTISIKRSHQCDVSCPSAFSSALC